MPNTKNIRLWVNALRSGKYTQGVGCLHDFNKNTFCCLGVACEVARENGVQMEVAELGGGDIEYDNDSAFLPASVQHWLGLDNGNPRLGEYTATELNDGFGASFGAIADCVEKAYLAYLPLDT